MGAVHHSLRDADLRTAIRQASSYEEFVALAAGQANECGGGCQRKLGPREVAMCQRCWLRTKEGRPSPRPVAA